jgi:TM2 domain-containing membrane protein YozV
VVRVLAPAVAAEAGGVKPLRRPNPQIAVGLALVPGLGQLYNGQPRKALFFFLWTVLTTGPAVLLIVGGQSVGHALLTRHLGALFLLVALLSVFAFLTLFLAGLFIWASSAIDAWQSAVAIGAGDHERAASRRMFRL